MSALRTSIAVSRVLLILGVLTAPVSLGIGALTQSRAVGFLGFAGIAFSIISLAWLKSCDAAAMIARGGLRALWHGSGHTSPRYPGGTALRDLPRLSDYLSAKRPRVVVLLLPPLFFFVGAMCIVVSVWLHDG